MTKVNVQKLKDLSAAQRSALTARSEADLSGYLVKTQPIIDAVRQEGDAALVRLGRELDKATSLTAAIHSKATPRALLISVTGPRIDSSR